MLKIFLVDDNPFMRKAMRQLIELEASMKVCGESETAEGALSEIERLKPTVALIDISLGGDERGIQLISEIRNLGYKFPILTISLHEESLYGQRVKMAGAQGYLMKQDAPENIISAIQFVSTAGPGEFFTVSSMSPA